MFQSTSASVALLFTIGLVLYQIELRDNTGIPDCHCGTSCHQDLKSTLRVDMYSIISGHSTAKVIFKWVPWCLISLRVLVTSLSIPAGVLYIVPLFDSVLMLSPGCSSDVTLLASNYTSSCVSHRLSPQVRQSTRRLQT